jgi:hypothetical protein
VQDRHASDEQDQKFQQSDHRAVGRGSGQTAYVCAPARYREAVENPDLAVGFPKKDVKFLEAAN